MNSDRPFFPDHPMLPFDLGRSMLNGWACGENCIGYSFADYDFQMFSDESYAIVMRFGLPKPMAPGPLKDVVDQIHEALCRLRKLPDGLVYGVPRWN